MIALVLIFIQAALFQNIEWRRAFNILSIALCIWMGYCILEIINPTSSLEGWILSRGLIFNGLIIVIITSLLCTRYSILKAIIFCLSIFTLFAVIKTLMKSLLDLIVLRQNGLMPEEPQHILFGLESAISHSLRMPVIWVPIWVPPSCFSV